MSAVYTAEIVTTVTQANSALGGFFGSLRNVKVTGNFVVAAGAHLTLTDTYFNTTTGTSLILIGASLLNVSGSFTVVGTGPVNVSATNKSTIIMTGLVQIGGASLINLQSRSGSTVVVTGSVGSQVSGAGVTNIYASGHGANLSLIDNMTSRFAGQFNWRVVSGFFAIRGNVASNPVSNFDAGFATVNIGASFGGVFAVDQNDTFLRLTLHDSTTAGVSALSSADVILSTTNFPGGIPLEIRNSPIGIQATEGSRVVLATNSGTPVFFACTQDANASTAAVISLGTNTLTTSSPPVSIVGNFGAIITP
jgi:hypothetical protein